jgi:hypothetical protein
MRQGETVFVDSGAWIALTLSRDPLHAQAREQWDMLHGTGAKLHTSVPVVIETASTNWVTGLREPFGRPSGLPLCPGSNGVPAVFVLYYQRTSKGCVYSSRDSGRCHCLRNISICAYK